MSVINRFFSFEQSVLVQSNVGKMMAYLWVICNETIDNKVFLQRFIEFGLQHQDLVGTEISILSLTVKIKANTLQIFQCMSLPMGLHHL